MSSVLLLDMSMSEVSRFMNVGQIKTSATIERMVAEIQSCFQKRSKLSEGIIKAKLSDVEDNEEGEVAEEPEEEEEEEPATVVHKGKMVVTKKPRIVGLSTGTQTTS
ncbi:hypothetical protein R1sor_024174 [Riccia sorocarpa]|uniref:Uncharacterized protein n=1 Tax=Riccia sorocarpa TaxID=122646 RepID=A0ABD3GQH8_9MARC